MRLAAAVDSGAGCGREVREVCGAEAVGGVRRARLAAEGEDEGVECGHGGGDVVVVRLEDVGGLWVVGVVAGGRGAGDRWQAVISIGCSKLE